jgi:predicted dehydrogenase
MTTPPINVGVIGLGFMGRTHVQAYLAAANAGFPCRHAAVADPHADRRAGNLPSAGNLGVAATERLFDPTTVRAYATPEELLADATPNVHLVSICTYTDSHVDLAIKALRAGKHVLLEKPVALRSADVRRLADVARDHPQLVCMPAMCMRFWPGWDWLKDRIQDRTLGAVRSATFQRLGAGPNWSADFYRNPDRSGGALFDLHIHDADFIYWAFGPPRSIASTGSLSHLTTLYRYDSPPFDSSLHVAAEAAWDLAPTAGFRMRYLVNFEHATAEFDVSQTPSVILHTKDGSTPLDLPAYAGYEGEVRHFVSTIAAGRTDVRATLDDAVAVTELLEAEAESLRTGREISLQHHG